MPHDLAYAELITLLSQYTAGTLSAEGLRTRLETPQLSAALQALIGQTLSTAQGDQITVGNITDAKGVAVGAGALAIGEVVVQITGPQPTPPTRVPEPQPPRSTVSALKRATLERRIVALTEEYTAVNTQIDMTIDAAQKLRLQRRADDLLAEIERIQAELEG